MKRHFVLNKAEFQKPYFLLLDSGRIFRESYMCSCDSRENIANDSKFRNSQNFKQIHNI